MNDALPRDFQESDLPTSMIIEVKMANSLTFSYCFAGLVIKGHQLSTSAVIAVAVCIATKLFFKFSKNNTREH